MLFAPLVLPPPRSGQLHPLAVAVPQIPFVGALHTASHPLTTALSANMQVEGSFGLGRQEPVGGQQARVDVNSTISHGWLCRQHGSLAAEEREREREMECKAGAQSLSVTWKGCPAGPSLTVSLEPPQMALIRAVGPFLKGEHH